MAKIRGTQYLVGRVFFLWMFLTLRVHLYAGSKTGLYYLGGEKNFFLIYSESCLQQIKSLVLWPMYHVFGSFRSQGPFLLSHTGLSGTLCRVAL